MNPRERILATLLAAVALLGGLGFFGYSFLWKPYKEKTALLADLKVKESEKLLKMAAVERDRPRLALARSLSLPSDPAVARREYTKYITELFSRSGVAPGKLTVTSPAVDVKSNPTLASNKKEMIYQKQVYNVQCYASMRTLTTALEEFYRTGLLHQIKSLNLQRQATTTGQDRADELNVQLIVEALIVSGGDGRTWLLPNIDRRLLTLDVVNALRHGPTGLGLALWAVGPTGSPELDHGPLRSRQDVSFPVADAKGGKKPIEVTPPAMPEARHYAVLAKKNIFLGRPPRQTADEGTPNMMSARHSFLYDITIDNKKSRTVALLRDRLTDAKFTLRATSGYDQFLLIRDGLRNTVVVGSVVKMDDNSLVFRVRLNLGSGKREAGDFGFYEPTKEEKDDLIKDKVIKAGEEGLVYWAPADYWELLVRQKAVRVRESNPDSFRLVLERDSDRPIADPDQSSPAELTSGKVLLREEDEVLIKIEDRYYGMHAGDNIDTALKKPLDEKAVKDQRVAAQ